ncbi:hypothetical protein C8R44DRAFT_864829 [Mycena epipterygia]|nr:hypothetical protein C8R44DRAFT_864829 [Mycena epipterygia]
MPLLPCQPPPPPPPPPSQQAYDTAFNLNSTPRQGAQCSSLAIYLFIYVNNPGPAVSHSPLPPSGAPPLPSGASHPFPRSSGTGVGASCVGSALLHLHPLGDSETRMYALTLGETDALTIYFRSRGLIPHWVRSDSDLATSTIHLTSPHLAPTLPVEDPSIVFTPTTNAPPRKSHPPAPPHASADAFWISDDERMDDSTRIAMQDNTPRRINTPTHGQRTANGETLPVCVIVKERRAVSPTIKEGGPGGDADGAEPPVCMPL